MNKLGFKTLIAASLLAVGGCGSTAITPLSWTGSTPAPDATQGAVMTASPLPSPTPSVGLMGSVWQNLNDNTAATAAGEYQIIQQLEGAFIDRVQPLLNRP